MSEGKSILKEFIETYPSILSKLPYSAQEIRKFWTSEIKRHRNPIIIYASMLRNGLIPKDEITESNEMMSYLNQLPEYEMDNEVLIANGFGDAMYQQLFVNHNTESNYKHFL